MQLSGVQISFCRLTKVGVSSKLFPSRQMVEKWFANFKRGRANADDAESSSLPNSTVVPKSIEKSPQNGFGQSQMSAGKVLATVFWDVRGILFIDYIEKGRTINILYNTSMFFSLFDACFAGIKFVI